MPTKKRQLAPPLSVRRRLQLLAFRDAGGHGGKPPTIIIVAISSVSQFHYSLDLGATWVQNAVVGDWRAITWSSTLSRFVAVGVGIAGYSSDGINWTTQALTGTYFAVAWAPELSLFVAIGSTTTAPAGLATSPDGIAWTVRATGLGFNVTYTKILWNGALFCAARNGNKSLTSPDGIVWTNGANNDQVGFPGFGWNGTRFANGTINGFMGSSLNGSTWTLGNLLPSAAIPNQIGVYLHGKFVFLGSAQDAAWTSTDGLAWTQGTVPAGAKQGIVWTGTKYLALIPGANVITSLDGATWVNGAAYPSGLYVNGGIVINK